MYIGSTHLSHIKSIGIMLCRRHRLILRILLLQSLTLTLTMHMQNNLK